MTVGLWDSVTGFFEDLGDFFSGKDFFECAGYAWNDMMQLASDVLTKNPAKGTYKDVWESISTIYTTLNVVAVSLLCVFFLYGFCRDSCDLHTDLTFDKTIKMFIRLIITSNVLSMALSYMPKFFSWGKSLTQAILGDNGLYMVYDFDGVKVYEKHIQCRFRNDDSFFNQYTVLSIYSGLWLYRSSDRLKSYLKDLYDCTVCRGGIIYFGGRRTDGTGGIFLYSDFLWICVFRIINRRSDCDQWKFY